MHRMSVARKLCKAESEVEKTLWHGTKQESLPYITHTKFDRGLSGAVGKGYLEL